MKPYIYMLICINSKGWEADGLWHGDYRHPENRVFRTRREAAAARRLHDEFDYTSTTDVVDEDLQPEFAVVRVPTVEAAAEAVDAGDLDYLESVMDAAGAPKPAWVAAAEVPPQETMLELFGAWLDSLPPAAVRAAASA